MLMTERTVWRRLALVVAGGALMLVMGTTGRSEAQGPAPVLTRPVCWKWVQLGVELDEPRNWV